MLWLRLFPALVSIAAVVPIVLLARKLSLTKYETTLALLLLAVNGYLIKYAQEIRMYCVLFFLSACSLWLFVSLLNPNKEDSKWQILSLTTVNLLMIYTHYYGWLLVAMQVGAVLLMNRKLTKQIIISFGLLFISYIPWFVEIGRAYESNRAVQNIGWIPRPGFTAVFDSLAMLHQPFIFPLSNADTRVSLFLIGLVLLAFLVPIALLMWQFKKRRPRKDSQRLVLLIVFAFAPFILAATLSWSLPKSIWGTRHLIIAIVPYSMLAASALNGLREYWARVGALLIWGCWFLATAFYVTIKPAPNYVWCAWNPLARQLMSTKSPQQPVAVYAFEDLVAYHLWFALRDTHSAEYRISVMKGVPGTSEDPAYFLPRDFNDVSVRGAEAPKENDIWIAFHGAHLDVNGQPLQYFAGAGYQLRTVLTQHAENQDVFLVELHRK